MIKTGRMSSRTLHDATLIYINIKLQFIALSVRSCYKGLVPILLYGTNSSVVVDEWFYVSLRLGLFEASRGQTGFIPTREN